MHRSGWGVLAVLASAGAVCAQGMGGLGPLGPGPGKPGPVEVRLISSHARVAPGQAFHVAVELTIENDWVFYSPDPGGSKDYSPMPGELRVQAGRLEVGEALWPRDAPHETDVGNLTVRNHVYERRAVVYVPLRVPAYAAAGEQPIRVTVLGQVCKDVCVNLDNAWAETTVTIGPAPAVNPLWQGDLAAGRARALTVEALRERHAAGAREQPPAPSAVGAEQLTAGSGLALALLAGLILNIMPCVLPVIPLRILSIVNLAGQSRRRFVTMGLAFAGGIVLFFAGVAGTNALLRLTAGHVLHWGRQFQSAGFRVAVTLVLVGVAANLFGLFTVTVPRKVAALEGRRLRAAGHLTSLGMGVMMAVLATPCSFAILALALAWAQAQPVGLGALAIVLIGVGMAAPHALLAAFPGLVNRLPRPGRWMELFQQSMGFLVLLAAVWLLGTLGEGSYPFWVAGYAVVLCFALWAAGTWVRYDAPAPARWGVRLAAAALAAVAGVWMLRPTVPPAVAFEPFDRARITSATQAGRIVLVKFTAKWCLSCQWVERTIYRDAEAAARLKEWNVLPMRADVTSADSPARGLLYDQLHGAPPLTVVYPPGGGTPVYLVGKFSKAELFRALEQARGKP